MKEITVNQWQNHYILSDELDVIIDFLQPGLTKIKKHKHEDFKVKYVHDHKLDAQEESFANRIHNKTPRTFSVVIISSYECNMQCVYCYEGETRAIESKMTQQQIRMIIECIATLHNQFGYNKLEITLLGGEPLLIEHKLLYSSLFEGIRETMPYLPVQISIITNGLEIHRFVPSSPWVTNATFQVTLDGPEFIHNKRRIPLDQFVNGFQKITENIDLLLSLDLRTEVRVNIDHDNYQEIPGLVEFVKAKKWNRNELFSMYLYPVSENGCQKEAEYESESKMLKKLVDTIVDIDPKDHFFKLAFHGVSFVDRLLKSKMPLPHTKFCAATINQYVFDPLGNVYSCWWGISDKNFKIGEFSPKSEVYKIWEDSLTHWHTRDVQNIDECQRCKYKYICGAGCAYKSQSKKGYTHKSNCSDFELILKEYLGYKSIIGEI
ncbi:MAG: SPASM domain-containing protein [Candidatus Cloacimonadaceae bacterium]|jgi:uncharacterized protein|nr:SPASM domain-containing protein [Candidatus Cloacimonadota bacterium]MCB5257003.1 SPASM domain-containing protein [Candidatus Cloacimonadota bacterium]MCB5276768.1 SPASM domain-containing protein [Candidatus Cloacimonadota bacterium]MCK9434689.1 SPASM domain-containing protein [Candidatus Cloacimonadota bacterium]MDD3548190.1 SPASM domain-containing protein [Candidatus Cloacimonadota bacterium]